jgi:hypothetical protein
VAPETGPAQGTEEVLERLVSQEIEGLVGQLEAHLHRGNFTGRLRPRRLSDFAQPDIALVGQALDEVADESRGFRVILRVRRVLGSSQELLRDQRPAEQRLQDGLVERLQVLVRVRGTILVRAVEAGLQQEVGKLVEQLLDAETAPVFAGVLAVSRLSHDFSGGARPPAAGSA